MKAQISRELDRLELLLEQIKVVETERNRVLLSPAPVTTVSTGPEAACDKPREASSVAMLTALRGIGADGATQLWSDGLSRHFSNRRQVAAYTGLAPTPWQSGGIAHEQGVSKAGNPRLRRTMVQIAWLWLRHQPQSALARWYFARVGAGATGTQEVDDHSTGAQAARGSVEICHRRRAHRGRDHEACRLRREVFPTKRKD